MSQHFLLSPACRPLTIAKVLRMTEEAAYREFCKARWPNTDGEPWCPCCGVLKIYEIRRRLKNRRLSRRLRCSACRHDFSVTSGTIFASHKLSFRQMLGALVLSVDAVKNEAALLLTRQLGVSYKTAFVLMMKTREAIAAERPFIKLEGEIEIDGTFIGGHVRKENKVEDRKDRRLAENQNGKRRCILAMRQRGEGGRIVTVVTMTESAEAAISLARQHIARGSKVITDAHEAYGNLGAYWEHSTVDHEHQYRADDEEGTNTNQIESFFSRIKRAEKGTHHHMAGKYLDWYAAELAWREDMRRQPNIWLVKDVLLRVMAHPVSRWLKGYWQKNHPDHEFLWNPKSPYGLRTSV